MTEQPPTSEAEQVKEILDRTVQELKKASAGQSAVPADEDGVPTYEMPVENQVPLAELDEETKKKLGVKVQ
jgi:hypothetical protein